jgi:galactokinase
MSLQTKVTEGFQRRYQTAPQLVVRAPGRVNLIGEHTDYNDGFVLPMAIDRAVWIALSPVQHDQVSIYSIDKNEAYEFELAMFENDQSGWAEYIKSIAWVLKAAGYDLRGWRGVMAGDVPIGSGLSSSAAVEMATARAFTQVSEIPWNPATIARLAQQAENEWVGVSCGIMDQMISAAGVAGSALLIDCRTLETQTVPLPSGTVVVVLDTATRRGLVDSAYNERRKQCEEAAQFFGVAALRDVTPAQFEARASQMDAVTRRRARHIIYENERTLQAAEAMRSGDAERLGDLINASHNSLRDDYEVSSRELDLMVELARQHGACYGARMTGAGFGGCAMALVDTEAAKSFAARVTAAYFQQTKLEASLYICQPSQGAEVVVGG